MLENLSCGIHIAIAIVFFTSFYMKAFKLQDFKFHMTTYTFVPNGLRTLAVYGVLSLELVLSFLLATQLAMLWVDIASIGLLLFFTITLFIREKSGGSNACGCFGSAELLNRNPLIRNVILAALLILDLLLPAQDYSVWLRIDFFIVIVGIVLIFDLLMEKRLIEGLTKWKIS